MLCIVNISEEVKVIEKYTKRKILFSNKEALFTKYEIVIPKKIYIAIEINF